MPSLNFARTENVELQFSRYSVYLPSDSFKCLSEHANKASELEKENNKLKSDLESLKKRIETDPKLIKKCFVENTKKLTDLLYKEQYKEKNHSRTDPNKFIQMVKDYDESLADFVNMFFFITRSGI